MAGVIAILRLALQEIATSGGPDAGRAQEALDDAARLSQDCLRAESRVAKECSDEHLQYTRLCD